MSFGYNLLAKRGEAHLGDSEAGNSKRHANYRAAKDYASDHCSDPKPQTGEHDPDDIEQKRAHARAVAFYDVLAEWEERELRDAERCDSVWNSDDRAAEYKARDQP